MKEVAWVIGSKSFIGKHLVTHLKNKGLEVIEYGREEMSRKPSFIVPEKIDYIFNLAAAGSKKGPYSDWEMFRTNTHLPFSLLMSTQDVEYKMFFQFSTSSVYGRKESSMREDSLLEANFPYSYTKAAADMLALGFARFYNKPVTVVRPFTVYGPGMQSTKLIPVVFDKIGKGELMDVVEGEHDFVYISDFIKAIDCMMSNIEHVAGQVVNVGSQESFTNEFIISMIESVCGKKAFKRTVESLNGHKHHKLDSDVWIANCNLLNTLGWRPEVSLWQGLTNMYEEYKK